MATVPGQLIWEIVERNNSYLVKEFGRGNASVQFSKEPNNLFNLNSYKHSGFANQKTVTFNQLVADNYFRPDLKDAALARLSAVHRILEVAKSGVKKGNRQAIKVRGRK